MTAPPAPRYLAGGEPFSFPAAGDVAALLVHGFTGTPYEMRPVGEHLARLGIGAEGIALTGHATHPRHMEAARHTDWIADAEAGFERLARTHRRVFVVGLSMGGTLVLNLAARRADDPRLAGVATISAPVVLDDWRLRLLKWAVRVMPWQPWGRPDISDPAAARRHVGYTRFRTRAVYQLLALMDETRALLPRVRSPLLVVHAHADHVVPPVNGRLIYERAGSADKRLVWLEAGYHVATVDVGAPILNEELARFVAARASTTHDAAAGAPRAGRGG